MKADSPSNDRGFPSKVEAHFSKNTFVGYCIKCPPEMHRIQVLQSLPPWVSILVAIRLKNCFDGRFMKCADLHRKLHVCKPPFLIGEEWGQFTNMFFFCRNYIKCQALNRKAMLGNSHHTSGGVR